VRKKSASPDAPDVVFLSESPNVPDVLLNLLSLVRLMGVLGATGVLSTDIHRGISKNNWPQVMRLAIGIEESVNFALGMILLLLSLLLNDRKRPNDIPFFILKGGEFLFSLIAGILILSDLEDNTARSDVGFLFIILSFAVSKISDIFNIDKAYGGAANFINKGDAKYQHAGNFNLSCCPYGFVFHDDSKNKYVIEASDEEKAENSTEEFEEFVAEAPNERTPLSDGRKVKSF